MGAEVGGDVLDRVAALSRTPNRPRLEVADSSGWLTRRRPAYSKNESLGYLRLWFSVSGVKDISPVGNMAGIVCVCVVICLFFFYLFMILFCIFFVFR